MEATESNAKQEASRKKEAKKSPDGVASRQKRKNSISGILEIVDFSVN